MESLIIAFGIAVTVGAYVASRWIARRVRSPFTTPVFFSTPIIIACLLAAGVRLEDYEPAKNVMVFLLGPATVALAIPLDKSWSRLAGNALPMVLGVAAGSLATLLAAAFLAKLFALSPILVASIGIKSVTAPIAIELAPTVRADPTLASVFVVATGMIGAMVGPRLMSGVGIHTPLARGLALGTISHGQGTAQALDEGETAGAAAGLAMGLAAVLTSLGAPAVLSLLV